jgi:hypothetical protein
MKTLEESGRLIRVIDKEYATIENEDIKSHVSVEANGVVITSCTIDGNLYIKANCEDVAVTGCVIQGQIIFEEDTSKNIMALNKVNGLKRIPTMRVKRKELPEFKNRFDTLIGEEDDEE